MKSFVLSAVCLLVTFLIACATTSNAQAQGFHFGGAGVHVDVGSPRRYYGNYGGYYGGYNSGCGYGSYPYTAYYGAGYGAGYGGHAHWHDTTHLDYHPGEFVPHRGHYHYVPGHYDVHEEGHWDHHGF